MSFDAPVSNDLADIEGYTANIAESANWIVDTVTPRISLLVKMIFFQRILSESSPCPLAESYGSKTLAGFSKFLPRQNSVVIACVTPAAQSPDVISFL